MGSPYKTIPLCCYVMCLVKNQLLKQTVGYCMHRKDVDHSLINLNASQVEKLLKNNIAVVWAISYSMLGSVLFLCGIL